MFQQIVEKDNYLSSLTLFKVYVPDPLKNWMCKCELLSLKIGEEFIYKLLFAIDKFIINS